MSQIAMPVHTSSPTPTRRHDERGEGDIIKLLQRLADLPDLTIVLNHLER